MAVCVKGKVESYPLDYGENEKPTSGLESIPDQICHLICNFKKLCFFLKRDLLAL